MNDRTQGAEELTGKPDRLVLAVNLAFPGPHVAQILENSGVRGLFQRLLLS
jgi:hypothetical protein